MMTNQEKQQLSRDVAEKYGIAPYRFIASSIDNFVQTWLHEDSARCFDLMVEHEIDLVFTAGFAIAYFLMPSGEFPVRYADHNNDKPEATRIAILKALLAKGE